MREKIAFMANPFVSSTFLSSPYIYQSFYSSGCTAEIHHWNANQFWQYDTGQDT